MRGFIVNMGSSGLLGSMVKYYKTIVPKEVRPQIKNKEAARCGGPATKKQGTWTLTRPIYRMGLLLQLRPGQKDLLVALRSRLSGGLLHALRIVGGYAAAAGGLNPL